MIIDPNENYRKYLPAVGMVLFFIVGFLAAYFWMNAKAQKASQNYATKLAENQKGESCLPQAPKLKMPNEIFSISGKVNSVDGQKISLTGSLFGTEKTYQVTVGPDTKIIKREIDLNPPKGSDNKTPPSSKDTDISLADIKAGDTLTVDSADNIKDKTEFIAKSVFLEITTGLPTPPAPPSAPDTSSIPTAPDVPKTGAAAPPAPAVPANLPAPPAAPK